MKFKVLPKYLSPSLEHFTRYIYPHCDHCPRVGNHTKTGAFIAERKSPKHTSACSHEGCQQSYIPRRAA